MTCMEVQRTYTIVFDECPELRRTLAVFGTAKRLISEACFNEGKTLNATKLQKLVYEDVKELGLTAQLTCSVIRSVAGAYSSAKSNKQRAKEPFGFYRDHAVYLVGKRGRDARFLEDGRISISTLEGRKKIGYREATGHVGFIERAKLINSINLVENDGRLEGRVCVTLEVAEPNPVRPVGVDLNETNAIVAMDADGEVFFLSGREDRQKAKRTRKTRARLQRKLASRKAQGKDTRSVRRALKRLGRKQRNRNRTSCQMMAAQLSEWAGEDAVLVLEDLKLERKKKGYGMSKALRRKLNGWPHGLMQRCISNRAAVSRQTIVKVNPAYTSQECNRCGQRGKRSRHLFSCSCGYQAHADVNASANLRDKYTALRRSGVLSVTPEALL